jgi:hypothetical protein
MGAGDGGTGFRAIFEAGADIRLLFDFVTPTGFEVWAASFDAGRELGGVGVSRNVRPILLPELLSAAPLDESVDRGEGFDGRSMGMSGASNTPDSTRA